MEILLNPISLAFSKSKNLPVFGLASNVISAFLVTLKFVLIVFRILHNKSAPITLGVPPPKYTVSTGLRILSDHILIFLFKAVSYTHLRAHET